MKKDTKTMETAAERGSAARKRVIIWGAGQAGAMMLQWLPHDCEMLCYVDSSKRKQGTQCMGYPVVSIKEALDLAPEEVYIAVLNKEAESELIRQLRDDGFAGAVVPAGWFRDRQDLRLAALRLYAEEIKRRHVPGALAELGVYQGTFAAEINRVLPARKLYLFDTFAGFDADDLAIEEKTADGGRIPVVGAGRQADFSDTDENCVRNSLPHPQQAVFVKGRFPESLEQMPSICEMHFALVSLDPDLYAPTKSGLAFFYPRMSPGGAILIHDYNSMQFPGVGRAVREFCSASGTFVLPLPDLHGTALLLKSER